GEAIACVAEEQIEFPLQSPGRFDVETFDGFKRALRALPSSPPNASEACRQSTAGMSDTCGCPFHRHSEESVFVKAGCGKTARPVPPTRHGRAIVHDPPSGDVEPITDVWAVFERVCASSTG